VLRAQFEAIAAVVGSVPVFEMRIPWGPPFRKYLGTEIVAASLVPTPHAGTARALGDTVERAGRGRHS